jgi:hypothetical protein
MTAERDLNPSEVYKASINKSLTSLSQCEFACVEIIHPQLMTAERDLNPQEYIKPVLTSLYCPPFSICVMTYSDTLECVVDQCWGVEAFRVSLKILCYSGG